MLRTAMNAFHGLVLVPILTLAIASCSKKEEAAAFETSSGSATQTEPESPPTSAEKKSGLELFTGSEVTLPAPIDALDFKMPVEQAAKLAPSLVGPEKKYGPLEGYDKAKVHIALTGGDTHLRAFAFSIENSFADLTAHLDEKWGESTEVQTAGGSTKRYWTNAKAGLRASAEERGSGGSDVVFEEVIGYDDFVGSEKGRFGFEKLPLLGASADEVKKAYEKELIGTTQQVGQISIPLPAPEFTEHLVFLTLKPDTGAIQEWQFSVSYSLDSGAREKMLTAFEEKFGPGKKGAMYIDYKGPPKVKVDHSGEQHTVWVK